MGNTGTGIWAFRPSSALWAQNKLFPHIWGRARYSFSSFRSWAFPIPYRFLLSARPGADPVGAAPLSRGLSHPARGRAVSDLQAPQRKPTRVQWKIAPKFICRVWIPPIVLRPSDWCISVVGTTIRIVFSLPAGIPGGDGDTPPFPAGCRIAALARPAGLEPARGLCPALPAIWPRVSWLGMFYPLTTGHRIIPP